MPRTSGADCGGGKRITHLGRYSPCEFIPIQRIHIQRQVWAVLFDRTDSYDHCPCSVFEGRLNFWPCHLLKTH
jgi:hypothetical protein